MRDYVAVYKIPFSHIAQALKLFQDDSETNIEGVYKHPTHYHVFVKFKGPHQYSDNKFKEFETLAWQGEVSYI